MDDQQYWSFTLIGVRSAERWQRRCIELKRSTSMPTRLSLHPDLVKKRVSAFVHLLLHCCTSAVVRPPTKWITRQNL